MSAGPASAETCEYAYCTGHDPYKYGCTISSTATEYAKDNNGVVVAVVWNRFSYKCHANWGEAQLTAAGRAAGYGLFVKAKSTYEKLPYMCFPGPNDTGRSTEDCIWPPYRGPDVAWTDMLDGTWYIDAWVLVVDAAGTGVAMSPRATQ